MVCGKDLGNGLGGGCLGNDQITEAIVHSCIMGRERSSERNPPTHTPTSQSVKDTAGG